MTVSIIIAVKTWQKNLEECVSKCLELDYPDFEIIILPDESIHRSEFCPRPGNVAVSVFPTGPVCPADKRDIAAKHAKGEILAFIDDDAYPEKDWLKNAIENFRDESVGAVGGPAVTSPKDSLRQKASGLIFQSILVSAKFVYRYLPKRKRFIDDYPSCNLLVRNLVMKEVGGFNTKFWPGEDTKLCLDITKRLGLRIIYDPKVLVYHHRRPVFCAHLKQAANYAMHRGFFAKKYPETSLKFAYFVPSIFLTALILGAVFSLILAPVRNIYSTGLLLYLAIVFGFSINRDLRLIPLVFFGIILTHLAYGFYFVKGLISGRLKEEA